MGLSIIWIDLERFLERRFSPAHVSEEGIYDTLYSERAGQIGIQANRSVSICTSFSVKGQFEVNLRRKQICHGSVSLIGDLLHSHQTFAELTRTNQGHSQHPFEIEIISMHLLHRCEQRDGDVVTTKVHVAIAQQCCHSKVIGNLRVKCGKHLGCIREISLLEISKGSLKSLAGIGRELT